MGKYENALGWANRFEWRISSIMNSQDRKRYVDSTIEAMRLHNFNYFVQLSKHNSFDKNMLKWFDDVLTNKFASISDLNDGVMYFFENEDEAVLFKLVWE